MGPSDSPAPSTGSPDRQTLRLLERQFVDDPLVDTVTIEPDTFEPRALRAVLDADQYPPSVSAVRLDGRWSTSGDFWFHYVETHADHEGWECRWDRHPNSHDPRLHFHAPPDATRVTDLSFPSLHPLDVSGVVLAAIERRIESLWAES